MCCPNVLLSASIYVCTPPWQSQTTSVARSAFKSTYVVEQPESRQNLPAHDWRRSNSKTH
jgi:hypothetical protein